MSIFEQFELPGLLPVIEASGTTNVVPAAGGALNFIIDVWAYSLNIQRVKVVAQGGAPSLNFNFQLYETVARNNNVLAYQTVAANTLFIDNLAREIPYRAAFVNGNVAAAASQVAQNPFWCTITNNDPANACAFFVQIYYRAAGFPMLFAVRPTIPGGAGGVAHPVLQNGI